MSDKSKRQIGSIGEQFAKEFLISNGYSIIKSNYRVGRFGEIDIIARNFEYICFIEVKTRSSNLFGTPGESVSFQKQKKIHQLAAIFLQNTSKSYEQARFDVIEVMLDTSSEGNQQKSINHIKNAF